MSAVLARARVLVGVPFRLQGRNIDRGIDCVGLAILAGGVTQPPKPDYRRRGNHFAPLIERSDLWFRRVSPRRARAGDIAVIEWGARNWHLVVLDEGGIIHADGRVGRVVTRPGAIPGTVRAVLRRRRRTKRKD